AHGSNEARIFPLRDCSLATSGGCTPGSKETCPPSWRAWSRKMALTTQAEQKRTSTDQSERRHSACRTLFSGTPFLFSQLYTVPTLQPTVVAMSLARMFL